MALREAWRVVPPAAISLSRISAALGLKEAAAAPVAKSADEAMKEAVAAGLPVFHGKPDDPMLAFLD